MELAARTGAWRPIGAPLPYDAEVEYLESTGVQRIITGIIPTDFTIVSQPFLLKYDFKCMYPSDVTSRQLNGCQGGYYIGPCNGELQISGAGQYTAPLNFSSGNVHTISNVWMVNRWTSNLYNNFISKLIFDEEDYTFDSSILGGALENRFYNESICIFSLNSQTLPSKCRIYYFKIFINEVCLRDFIPIRFTNSLGQTEGAMYDRVSGQLFRNAGTGAFVIGPDKVSQLGGGGITANA